MRIQHNTRVARCRNGTAPAYNFFRNLARGEVIQLRGQRVVWGQELSVTGTRLMSGEFLIILSPDASRVTAVLGDDKRRWEIETLFKALKSQGFDFEATHLTELDRIERCEERSGRKVSRSDFQGLGVGSRAGDGSERRRITRLGYRVFGLGAIITGPRKALSPEPLDGTFGNSILGVFLRLERENSIPGIFPYARRKCGFRLISWPKHRRARSMVMRPCLAQVSYGRHSLGRYRASISVVAGAPAAVAPAGRGAVPHTQISPPAAFRAGLMPSVLSLISSFTRSPP